MAAKYFDYTRREILPLLPDTIARALEIGCGTGNTLSWLRELKQCNWIGGVEVSPEAAASAREKLDAVFEGNIEEMDLPIEKNSLDLVLCLDVLEHLIDPWRMVRRLRDLLKPGGALIVSVPNVRNRDILFPLLFKGKWEYAEAGLLDRSHLRFFVRDTAVQLVESSGLRVDKVDATGLGRSRKSRFINSMLPRFITSLFIKQYLIRGIRQESA
jgi:SAM-dependent methyltransferase